ncbi:phosphoglucosamine mutase [Alistipes sp. CAG:268]|jgi:phosphomannomutase|uniref:phosphoglucosamine mutase n=1 Tax=Alistipes sp. CAG:268 TaxID=1262693 RepID=UPI000341150F|nr:phosphoglucosamine mutase [Alistipes sp. CAG:268]CDC98057.1 phosphomannomutase [Alistipes sp. CAG:268]HBL70492.1 phosphoglucosamine mutase [Alistipes sp.]HBW01304.1 phosphoglucosamine mutase [Alistipes sp.]
MTLIKSISGIRGTIGGPSGENLTPPDVVKFTTAYVRLIAARTEGRKPVVVVGRDARISGEMVANLVEGTLLACGADVINAGLCTTPGTEMAVIVNRADGGIIITASHNPRQWNALKLLNSRGEFLSDAEGKQVLAMSEEEFDYPEIDAIGHVLSRAPFNDEHIRRVLALPLVDVEAVRRRRYKVVVDAVNSVGGVVIPKLLRELGCEVVELNCEPTGDFAHNPEPLPENLTGISEAVVREKADLGVVVDPDVDRLAFVSEDGTMFGEEYTLVAVADYILSKTPGDTVSNLSSSRALRDVTERHGCRYYASAVGEVNVTTKMREVGAVIGGEGNGGVIYPELHYGRDALVGTALFLTWLTERGLTMTQLRATYPSYFASKNKIQLTPAIDVDKVLREVKGRYSNENVNDIDGVKIDFPENWVHLRKSNTEPIIRVYTEAKSMDEADALAKRFIAEIEAICKE